MVAGIPSVCQKITYTGSKRKEGGGPRGPGTKRAKGRKKEKGKRAGPRPTISIIISTDHNLLGKAASSYKYHYDTTFVILY